KRVETSISRRVGCHEASEAERNSVYRPTASASAAGTAGMPSVTRLSLGAMTAGWASAKDETRTRRAIGKSWRMAWAPPGWKLLYSGGAFDYRRAAIDVSQATASAAVAQPLAVTEMN